MPPSPPTPHRLLGRDGISCGIPREKPISFGTLPPAGSERVYACVYLGGEALLGTSSPAEQSTPPPGLRSAAEGWYGAAPSLPPSFSSSLLPLPQGRDGGRSADGRTERAAGAPPGCGQAEREEQEVGDPRRVRGSLGRLSSSLVRQRGLCGKLEARSPHRGAPRGRPRGCGAAAATRSHRGLGAKRAGTPRNPPPWETGSGSVPPPRVGAGGIRGGGCARTWGAGNGVCRRDGDKDNGICFGNGAKIMGFALGMVTKIRCRLPADRAGEALCRLLRFGRAAA